METESRYEPFPATHWSVVSGARAAAESERSRSLDELARIYWRPIYAHLRLRWNRPPPDAMDLTQAFFVRLLDGGQLLQSADPARGRFRAYLKTALDHFVSNELRADRAQRRGGGLLKLSLEAEGDPDRFLDPRAGESPDDALDRHWRRAVLDEAIRRLEAKYASDGRATHFAVFRRYDLAERGDLRPTYDDLAREFGVTRTDVDTRLRQARKDLIGLTRDILSSSVRGREELDEEEREFYGGRP